MRPGRAKGAARRKNGKPGKPGKADEEMQSDRREVRRFLRQSVRLERGLLPQLMPSSTGKVNCIGGESKEPEAQDQS
ncbi:hypothetical protein HaLaN_27695, partial [Haematococcus lacustris]